MSEKRLKGKFIRTRELVRREKVSTVMSKRWKEKRNTSIDEKRDISNVCEGNRIFNLSALANNLQCKVCKDTLSFKNVVQETREGLHSTFLIKCLKCEVLNQVHSGDHHAVNNEETQAHLAGKIHNNVTTNAVLGAVNAGIGCTELNKILMCLDIPEMNYSIFKRYEKEVGPAIEAAARRSCRKAAAEERKLVLSKLDELHEELPVEIRDEFVGVLSNAKGDSNNNFDGTLGAIVNIIVSYDMGWSKRGNGRSYDSLNGYGAIIGFLSKKILDYRTRNRKYRSCDLGRPVDKHDCRKNFTGSAKAMEADAGAEMLTKSTILKESNLNVKIVVGDEDSSLMSAVKKSNHGSKIYKLADMNHVKKNLSKKLYSLQSKHKSLCKKGLISHMKKCFSYAIAQNKGDSRGLAENVRCIPHHFFDKHENCGRWCKKVGNTSSGLYQQKFIIQDEILYRDLQTISDSYADNAFKFCISASSQANEAFNHTVSRKFPKNKSYSTSTSGDTRVACAVLTKNEGDSHLIDVKKSLNLDMSSNFIKSCMASDQKRVQKSIKALTIEKKKRRMDLALKRENLRKTVEKKEGLTYQSNIGFDKDYSNMAIPKVEKSKITVVVFDLETSGRGKNADILQIAATTEEKIFSVYIHPNQAIDPAASKVNGLQNIDGELYLHNRKVLTMTMIEALQSLYAFLNTISETCILIAHNAVFDVSFLLRDIVNHSLENEFNKIIYGFADSLKLLRRKFPERQGKGMFTLSKLAEDFLERNSYAGNFHEASYDVVVLQNLIQQYLTFDDIFENAIIFVESLKDFIHKFKVGSNKKDLSALKDVLSKYMITKLARLEITYEQLIQLYQSGEDSLITFLLQKVTKDKTILKNVVEHFRRLKYHKK